MADTTYCLKAVETDQILDFFPENVRAEIREHMKNGTYNTPEFIEIDMNIWRALSERTLDFNGKMIGALFAYGFIEGQRHEQEIV